MEVNLTHPELAEITNATLPAASLDALKSLRTEMCSSSSDFSLQSHQKFLRRVLSPDAPTRSLLMVHGTGVGKTCTAIQIAEEFILRPEYQDKKVLVLASPAVQENFHTELFDMSRVSLDETSGVLSSHQCTGRRYLDVLLRADSEPKHWKDQAVRDRLSKMARKLIDEFYEFSGYATFGDLINENANDEEWIHRNFDNRLVLLDEAHNIRRKTGMSHTEKAISSGIETLVKTAKGLVLVLMTATPMFDSFEEIVYYMNLFGWNDRSLSLSREIKVADIFNPDATLKPESEERFRDWVQKSVSFVRGENPFTFPFRLPAPNLAAQDRTTSFTGAPIAPETRMKFLSLVACQASGDQLKVLNASAGKDDEEAEEDDKQSALLLPTVAVLPGNKPFREHFQKEGNQYAYTKEPFLTPDKLPGVSAKFAKVIETIHNSKGPVIVYSNYVEMGARLFAMTLEESGFRPAQGGQTLLKTPTTPKDAKAGFYCLLTSEVSDPETESLLALARSSENKDGSKVRVVIATRRISEGVNFRFIRQLHVLDPWWNNSRIEQVVGRALRTCSHALLPFPDQNCTVYLHIVRTDKQRECFDEYTYRTKVEVKAVKIARVRAILAESAMDCPLQASLNTLPPAWMELEVPQIRSENNEDVTYRLKGMLAPTFAENIQDLQCRIHESAPEDDYVRPYSTYQDLRDEALNTLSKLFLAKPIWERDELVKKMGLPKDVVVFTLKNAMKNAFRFKDSFGRPSLIESRGTLYALEPVGLTNGTLVERTSLPPTRADVPLPFVEQEAKAPADVPDIDEIRRAHEFPAGVSQFSETVLNGYIFDHVFTPEQRLAYLKSGNPLQFRSRIAVADTNILVLGNGVYEPPEEPIGDDRTRVLEWIEGRKKDYADHKDDLVATVRGGKFGIGRFELKDGVPTRVAGTRRDIPITCGTGSNKKPEVLALAKYLDKRGVGVPEASAKKSSVEWCLFTELFAREQQELAEPKIRWYTPEEIDVVLASGKT